MVTKCIALPTSLYEPSAVTLTHGGPGLWGLYILVPNFLSSVFLSSANSFLNLLISV